MALTPQQQNTLVAIKSAAAAHNVDWRVMAALAHHESNLGQSTYGDGGHAIGPFQLNNAGGVLTGLPEKEYQSYANPRKNADYAANALARLGITRGSGTVESQIQQGVNRFERPANKGAEIADATQWYRSTLAGSNPNAVTTPAAGVAPTTNKGMAQQVQPAASTPLQNNRLNLLAYTMANSPQARASGVAPSLGNLLLSQLMNPTAGSPMMPQPQGTQQITQQPTITGQTPTSAGIAPTGIVPGTKQTRGGAVIGGIVGSANLGRTDMGVDFRGKGAIPAFGDGVVTRVDTKDTGWPGAHGANTGAMITYKLTSGPNAGKFVYIAESLIPHVQVGQKITAGQHIATALGTGAQTEMGWAADQHGTTLAHATTGYTEGQVTNAGKSFRAYLGL